MKLKPLFIAVFGVIVLGILAIALMAFNLNGKVDALQEATDVRYASYQRADELRQSSDELTRLGRTFVVTQDTKYRDMYFKVLDIRNGKLARPVDYHTIYWDLVLNPDDKPKPDGKTISLQKMMQDLNFSQQEFALLTEAQNSSDALVNLEVEAFAAADAGDFERAVALVHGQKYHQEKAKIMQPIQRFFEALEGRTQRDLVNIQSMVSNLVSALLVLTFLLMGVAIAGYILLIKRVQKPVLKQSHLIKRIQQNTDLSLQGEYASQDEIGQMSREFSQLISKIRGILFDTRDSLFQTTEASDSAQQLISNSRTLLESQLAETGQVVAAVNELASTMDQVASSTELANSTASKAADQARLGKEVGQDSLDNMDELRVYIQNSSDKVNVLAKDFQQIEGMLEVIKNIAEQTNLLALNAAIEAARAGEQGRGFAVVADEVRALAQRTQESTQEIESMMNELRDGVKNTVNFIEKGMGEVKKSSDSVSATMQSLDNIAEHIGKLTDMSEQIALNTEHQFKEINSVENRIDSVQKATSSSSTNLAELENKVNALNQNAIALQKKLQVFSL